VTCPHRIDVAAYVLDALEPLEADLMHDHLDTCPVCRPEYDDMCGLPVLLANLMPADVDDIVTPDELPDSLCEELIARAAKRRRRRAQRRLLVVAVTLIVGVTGGVTIASQQPATPDSVTVSATDAKTHVHASATLTSRSWGTQIRLQLSGVPWAQQCELVVNSNDGRQDTAATWIANYQGALNVTGTTAIPSDHIRRMTVVTMDGRLLVELPPPTH
jgi:hypothetical protein